MASIIRTSARALVLGNRTLTWSAARYQRGNAERAMSTAKVQPSPDATDRLKLTDSCVEQLKRLSSSDDKYLRVVVEGGGCSGFQYKFELDSNYNESEDRLFEKDGACVVIDNESLEFLKGSTLDYHEELIRSAFRIVDNPKSEQGCSCGASFSLKL